MIPDIAIIISAYAGVRLLNSYVLETEALRTWRVVLAIVAIVSIALALADVLSKSASLNGL